MMVNSIDRVVAREASTFAAASARVERMGCAGNGELVVVSASDVLFGRSTEIQGQRRLQDDEEHAELGENTIMPHAIGGT